MVRRLFIILLICLLFTLSTGAQSPQPNLNRQVWVFYLSFWAGENTWDWNDSVLTDYPLLGLYNSKMPDVVDVQIQQAMRTGIDAFIVNWWGIDEGITTTPALVNLLNRANDNGFELAVALDLFPRAFFRDRDQLQRSLQWLYAYVLSHPAYLHYNGKPVIFFAFQDRFNGRMWRDLRDSVDPEHDAIWIAEGLGGCCLYGGVMDGMYAFNMAWADGVAAYYIAERNLIYERGGEIYIPTISPGWDEDAIAAMTNRPNPTSPRDRAGGQFLIDSWNGALQTESDVILIVSWNEFIENSHIEPSRQYGTQALDVLQPLIAEWTGDSPPALSSLPDAYYVTARGNGDRRVRVLSQADRSATIIGQLEPNVWYRLLDEDNGLYAIDFVGQIGYVPWEQIRMRDEVP